MSTKQWTANDLALHDDKAWEFVGYDYDEDIEAHLVYRRDSLIFIRVDEAGGLEVYGHGDDYHDGLTIDEAKQAGACFYHAACELDAGDMAYSRWKDERL